MEEKKNNGFSLIYLLIALALIVAFEWAMLGSQVEHVSYTQFETMLKQHQFDKVEVGDKVIRAELKEPQVNGRKVISTLRVDSDLANSLSKYGVQVTGMPDGSFAANLLSWLLPMVIFLGLWFFLMRRMAGGGGGMGGGFMAVGKSHAKVAVEKDIKVTFDDVAGVDEAKDELKEIVAFLKDPADYGRLGARIPKGVLLVGPPGTGKTLLARAVAGQAGVPFFSINGSEFVEMFVGVGAARVRDLFEQARKSAPCIIFIDELDALGRARGLSPMSGGGADEKEQTLNQLLAELDGFDPSTGVVLLAATNRPEILDPALLRAGRFDRQVLVDRPDKTGRVQILKVHVRKVKLGGDVDLDQIAALTVGFCGADLANLVNEAAILATRRNAEGATMDDFTRAIERIVAGLEKKSRILNPHERKIIAYHETGHALVTLALGGSETVHKISIIPRGIGALGYNIQRPTEDRYLMTAEELENKMASLLGGRAAELLVFDKLSTGASDDLEKATDIARNMVMRYGMDEALGSAVFTHRESHFLGNAGLPPTGETRTYSEETAEKIDVAVHRLLEKALETARETLRRNRDILDATAQKLLAQETLTAEDLPKPEDLRTTPVAAFTRLPK